MDCWGFVTHNYPFYTHLPLLICCCPICYAYTSVSSWISWIGWIVHPFQWGLHRTASYWTLPHMNCNGGSVSCIKLRPLEQFSFQGAWKYIPALERRLWYHEIGLSGAFMHKVLKATKFCTIPWLCVPFPLLLAFYPLYTVSANFSEFLEGRINSKQIGLIFIRPFGHRIPADVPLNIGSIVLSNSLLAAGGIECLLLNSRHALKGRKSRMPSSFTL